MEIPGGHTSQDDVISIGNLANISAAHFPTKNEEQPSSSEDAAIVPLNQHLDPDALFTTIARGMIPRFQLIPPQPMRSLVEKQLGYKLQGPSGSVVPMQFEELIDENALNSLDVVEEDQIRRGVPADQNLRKELERYKELLMLAVPMGINHSYNVDCAVACGHLHPEDEAMDKVKMHKNTHGKEACKEHGLGQRAMAVEYVQIAICKALVEKESLAPSGTYVPQRLREQPALMGAEPEASAPGESVAPAALPVALPHIGDAIADSLKGKFTELVEFHFDRWPKMLNAWASGLDFLRTAFVSGNQYVDMDGALAALCEGPNGQPVSADFRQIAEGRAAALQARRGQRRGNRGGRKGISIVGFRTMLAEHLEDMSGTVLTTQRETYAGYYDAVMGSPPPEMLVGKSEEDFLDWFRTSYNKETFANMELFRPWYGRWGFDSQSLLQKIAEMQHATEVAVTRRWAAFLETERQRSAAAVEKMKARRGGSKQSSQGGAVGEVRELTEADIAELQALIDGVKGCTVVTTASKKPQKVKKKKKKAQEAQEAQSAQNAAAEEKEEDDDGGRPLWSVGTFLLKDARGYRRQSYVVIHADSPDAERELPGDEEDGSDWEKVTSSRKQEQKGESWSVKNAQGLPLNGESIKPNAHATQRCIERYLPGVSTQLIANVLDITRSLWVRALRYGMWEQDRSGRGDHFLVSLDEVRVVVKVVHEVDGYELAVKTCWLMDEDCAMPGGNGCGA